MTPVTESSAKPVSRSKVDRLYEIDALRIIAAVAVVVYHYTFADLAGGLTRTAYPQISLVTRYGYLGVDLFFVISGFVCLLTALNRKPHQFVISRIVRLYPAYWVAVTLTTVAAVLLDHGNGVSIVRYLTNLTMLNSLVDQPNIDVVYWTLWTELRFYAFIVLLTWIGMTRHRLTIALWTWTAISLVLDIDVLPGRADRILTLVFQPEWSHYFIAGMALCLIYRFGFTWPVTLVLAVAYATSLPIAVTFARHVGERYHSAVHPASVVAIVTAIFAVMLLVAVRITRRLARRWFIVLGALTYPLYLVHDHIGWLLFRHLAGVNRWIALLGIAAVMVAVAWLVNRYLEKPLAPRLKRALERGWATLDGLKAPVIPQQRAGDPEPAQGTTSARY
jgi:peptidoglycan/LPS O-acetylase OafA/YrhL